MGIVYEGWDPALERKVAIKVFKHPDPEHIRREAAAAARLNHPGIVAVHEIGANFIVMDLVAGHTLAEAWKAQELDARVSLLLQVADIVAVAHTAGIVHRDLKPANVLVDHTGKALLTDFGLAEASTDVRKRSGVAGTLTYMAPEQLRGETATPQADVWALGVMLFEVLMGERPFPTDDRAAIERAIAQGPPPLPSHPLSPVIATALSPSLDLRFADASHFARALRDVAKPSTRRGGPFKRTIGLFAAAAAVALAVWLARATSPGAIANLGKPSIGLPADLDPRERNDWFETQDRALTQQLAHAPTDRQARFHRGVLRLVWGEDVRDRGLTPMPFWETAAADLTRVVSEADGALLPAAHHQRGILFVQRCVYKRTIKIDPETDCRLAIADLMKAVEDIPEAYNWLGNARFHLGAWQRESGRDGNATLAEAEADLSRVRTAETLGRRGRVRAFLGHFEAAEQDFRDSVALGPDDPWILTWWGAALHQAGRDAQAVVVLTRALKVDNEHAEALAERGEAYASLGHHEAAVADFESAIRHNPSWQAILSERLERERLAAKAQD